MRYQILIPRPVQKQLDDLPPITHERILRQIATLQDNPRPHGCIKLKGVENEYRLRIGDYRLRYEVHDSEGIVVLLHCGHRKDIYRG